jgi:hypothetical protein
MTPLSPKQFPTSGFQSLRPLANAPVASPSSGGTRFGALRIQGPRAGVFEVLRELEQPFKLLELGERPNHLVNTGDQVALAHFDRRKTESAAHKALQTTIYGHATPYLGNQGIDMTYVSGNDRPVGNMVFPTPNNKVTALSILSNDEGGMKQLWKTLLDLLEHPWSKSLTDRLNTIHTKPLKVAGEHRTVVSFKPGTPQQVIDQLPEFKQAIEATHVAPLLISDYRRAGL